VRLHKGSGRVVFAAVAPHGPREIVRLEAQNFLPDPTYMAKARLFASIVQNCEVEHVFTLPRFAPLRTEVPDGSQHIVSSPLAALLAEAPGSVLKNLAPMWERLDSLSEDQLPVFERELSSWSPAIVSAAVIDTLINMQDRTLENMFATDDGHLTMIDSVQNSFDYGSDRTSRGSRGGGPDSILLPHSQLSEELRAAKGDRHAALFDYRCHTIGGHVGRSFAPPLKTCLERISGGRSPFNTSSSCV
jgi:hypothetical protein